jgi:hypothetical protein
LTSTSNFGGVSCAAYPRAPVRRYGWLGWLVALVVFAQTSAAQAQTVPPTSIDPAGFDNIGDSGLAPDIGKLQASVTAAGDLSLTTVGTWLNRSDLPASERAAWQIDVGPGGEPTYGGDYLVQVNGSDAAPDVWTSWRWVDGNWAQYTFPVLEHVALADGRVYWRTYFSKGASTPEHPVYIGLRALTTHTDGTTAWVDRAPDSMRPNLVVSLEPHGDADPLGGCTYDGGCVGGASGVSAFGPAPNPSGGVAAGVGGGTPEATPAPGESRPSAACTSARRSLAKVKRELAQAMKAQRRAKTRAARKRRARAVRKLRHRRATWQRRVRARC